MPPGEPGRGLVQHLHNRVLPGLCATDPSEVCADIDRFTAVRNETQSPFEWTKELSTRVVPRMITLTYASDH
jgi:hypothetical protein